MHAMRIIGVQMDIAWEDASANCAKASQLLARLKTGADDDTLIVLPEMFASGFSMNVESAVAGADQTEEFLRELSRNYHATVVAGVARKSEQHTPQNQALVTSPAGRIIARYTKLHPFTLGGERDCYQAGSEIITFPCGDFIAAPFICYDLRFPEIFRLAVRRGANLFMVIANWPISRAEHWLTLLRARAIENQAYVVGVNRVGRDPSTLYGGRSTVVDPMGTIRADAGTDEGLLNSEIDPRSVQQIRCQLPFLQDLRDEFSAAI